MKRIACVSTGKLEELIGMEDAMIAALNEIDGQKYITFGIRSIANSKQMDMYIARVLSEDEYIIFFNKDKNRNGLNRLLPPNLQVIKQNKESVILDIVEN